MPPTPCQMAAVAQVLAGRGRCPEPATWGAGRAPVNIALCKYWGKRDSELNLPLTDSLSLSLPPLGTETRLRLRPGADQCRLNGQLLTPDQGFARRLTAYLDLFRPAPDLGFEVATVNHVPTGAGLASSASGFAALVLALDQLFGWGLGRRELSLLARMGSGSACRSLYHGAVHWQRGNAADGHDSYAVPIACDWPDLCLGLLVLSQAAKPASSRDAMGQTVASSQLYAAWPGQVGRDLASLKTALATRDFELLGRTSEHNALSMHATMLSAWPPVCYWLPESLTAIRRVWDLRNRGLAVYLTMDAGPNLKLLFPASARAALQAEFPDLTILRPLSTEPTVLP